MSEQALRTPMSGRACRKRGHRCPAISKSEKEMKLNYISVHEGGPGGVDPAHAADCREVTGQRSNR